MSSNTFPFMSRTWLFESEKHNIFEALPETQYIWNLFNTRWLQYNNEKVEL